MGSRGISKLLVGGGVLVASTMLTLNFGGKRVELPAYEVGEVRDGDTFLTKEGLIIRLAAVYAPEKELCGGEEATEALKKLIVGKPLYIKAIFKDKYERLVSYVYTKDEYVNEKLLEQGMVYFEVSEEHSKGLKPAAERAREKKVGIFSEKCTQSTNPEKPECEIKGNVSMDGKGNKMYRYPGCGQYGNTQVQLYRGDRWFCTEEEAKKAGFVKGSDCK